MQGADIGSISPFLLTVGYAELLDDPMQTLPPPGRLLVAFLRLSCVAGCLEGRAGNYQTREVDRHKG